MIWNYLFCGWNASCVGALLWLIWHSRRYAPHVCPFNIKLAFGLVGLLEYEVYREACRIAGWSVAVSDWRIRYLFVLYFVLGFFTREVIRYAE